MIDVKDFASSNRSISAADLIKAVEDAVQTIHTLWENSPSDDADGRDELYKQVSGIRMGMLRVIRNLEE